MTTAIPKLAARTIAHFVSLHQSIDATGGGSLDLHIENRGNVYTPKVPTYLVAGVVPGIAYKTSEFVNQTPEQYEAFIQALTKMITEGEKAGATVVGWWEDDGIVYFDVSEEIDAEVFSIKLALNLAQRRNQLGIGLYLNGEYAHTILAS